MTSAIETTVSETYTAEEPPTLTATRTPAKSGVGSRKAIVTSLLTDLVAPLGLFYGLRAGGVSQWWSLLISSVGPAAVVVHRFITRRQVEWFALFIMSVIALGLVLSALTGDPRTMLIRDAWSGMLMGLAGIWMLASVISGRRPVLMTLIRSFVITKSGPEGYAAWDARWDNDPAFRHGVRVVTTMWGLATILNAVVNLTLAYALPIDAAPAAMHLTWPVILVPTLLFHVRYTKTKNLRA